MHSPLLPSESAWVSTGHLPTGEVVQELVEDAHRLQLRAGGGTQQ